MKEIESTTSSSSATIVACGAVSAILMISLAIAIIEAVAAIKRKFSYSSNTTVSNDSKEDSSRRIHGSAGITAPRQNPRKKISLPEFTWLRHIRRCAKSSSQQPETNNNNTNCKNPSLRTVHDSLSSKILQESCGGRKDSKEEVDGCWSPVSHLRQMGAARFTAIRRISTPVAPRKISSIHGVPRKLSECPCSPSRHSMAVSSSFATLPITPGVARLCSSLTDILEGGHTENHSLESDSSLGRNHLSVADAMIPTTALEARLKRVRLIRHR